MTRRKHASSGLENRPDTDLSGFDAAAVRGVSRSGMLRRQAEMVAVGEMPVLPDLADDELRLFIEGVRQIRRERLLDHITRVIALDIRRDRGERRKVDPDAQEAI